MNHTTQPQDAVCDACEHDAHQSGQCQGASISRITGCHCQAEQPAVSPSVVVSTDRATLRDRIAAALYEHMHPGSYWSDTSMPSDWRPAYLEEADAVLAVLPEQTDRATLLREAATRLWHQTNGLTEYGRGARWAVAELRAMADCPACGVGVEHDVHGVAAETQDGEVDADTVAKRAAQVISTMGADIRTLTQERNRYRNAWHNARARASVAEQPDTRTREVTRMEIVEED